MFKFKMYMVSVSLGDWRHTYKMAAASSCGAILRAMRSYGCEGATGMRISAKPIMYGGQIGEFDETN